VFWDEIICTLVILTPLSCLFLMRVRVVLISLIVAVIQISLAKKTLNISSKRDAAKLAAGQIEVYVTRVIPLQNKLYRVETSLKINKVKIEVGEFQFSTVEDKLGALKYKEALTERLKVMSHSLNVINAMEAFSVYFTKGVADEEIAFSSVGQTFVHSVEDLYFDIATCVANDQDKAFQNLIQLYKIWSKRLEKHRLIRNHKVLSEQLQAIEDISIGPIGTNS